MPAVNHSESRASGGYGSRGYAVIHRSILSGLLGNIAALDEETRSYRASNDRRVALFPGSTLFRRSQPSRGGSDARRSGNC